MVAVIRFRPKAAFFYIVCGVCLLLLLSFTFFHQSIKENFLPFSENEITNANIFLHPQDIFRQSVPNINNLRYHQSSARPCYRNAPRVLAIVHSAPAHILHRKAIRQTWGSSEDDIRTVFIVGHSSQPQVWHRVTQEAVEHGDIVLVDMPDTYSNLTLKHLVGIRWALKNCPKASLFLKADDDALIDVSRVSKVVIPSLAENAVACRVIPAGSAPRRSGKWKVTRSDYPFDDYPEYCSGLAYFSRFTALQSMYKAAVSGRVPYLWIDDVFVTGFAVAYAGIKRVDLSVWFARTEEQVLQWIKTRSQSQHLPWMIAEISPRHWPSDAVSIWNKTRKN